MYKVSLNKSWVGTHYQTEIGPNRKKSSQSSGWIKEDYCRDVFEFGDGLGMRGFFLTQWYVWYDGNKFFLWNFSQKNHWKWQSFYLEKE